jgi:hypothetical protein
VLSLGSGSAIFIGYYIDTLGFYQNYASMWNGTGFTNLMPPGQGGRYAATNSEFTGISAVPGTNDIDIAGSRACPVDYVCPFVYVFHKLTRTWGPITTGVTPTTAGSYFLGIDAVSSTMTWAVGWYQGPTSQAALIEKFKDTTLTFVDEKLPTLPANTNLSAVAAESTTNALAVGASGTSTTAKPIALYWNGTAWAAASPSTTTVSGFLGVSNVPGTNTYFNVGTTMVSGIDKNLAMKSVCD